MTGERPRVTIYTDGACSGNPGPGGYGVLLVADGGERELARGYRRTTNNRMEILAAIAGLETLREPCEVALHSDSQYLVHAITKGWLANWRRNGWKKGDKSPVANVDLWRRLLPLLETHRIAWIWIRGHAGHDENERVDQLAVAALKSGALAVDEGYERG
ncbi:MAG: ribonuclease HI [Thermoanaerobaculia bacterium]